MTVTIEVGPVLADMLNHWLAAAGVIAVLSLFAYAWRDR
jgi:hypothetical protein